ncbi:hypothetical protein ACFSTA_08120 [Ornithinibacillus salinisoli]|uniref:Uncharacterized protein n=1 Tax=Ornithinibacillus salinisoli TaxID=1848459 RepID=A0ABW4VZF9_9BACI
MATKDANKRSDRTEVMGRLQSAGMKVLQGKKSPKNGRYSGIIGSKREERVLNI